MLSLGLTDLLVRKGSTNRESEPKDRWREPAPTTAVVAGFPRGGGSAADPCIGVRIDRFRASPACLWSSPCPVTSFSACRWG